MGLEFGGGGRQVEEEEFDVFGFFLTLGDGSGYECEASAIVRDGDLLDAQRSVGDGGCAGSQTGIFFGIGEFARAERCVVRDGCVEIEAVDYVAALVGAVADDVLPIFLVVVTLLFGPWLARCEVDGLRIGRPGEGMDLFVAGGDGKGFSAIGGDEVDLRGVFFVVVFVVIAGGRFAWGEFAFGEEGDPARVGRPLGSAVVLRLR